jgi:putative transposase
LHAPPLQNGGAAFFCGGVVGGRRTFLSARNQSGCKKYRRKSGQPSQEGSAKAKKSAGKRKPGRPKGSKNKIKSETVVLNPELLRIQQALRKLLKVVRTILSLKYVVLDGHFGNYPSAFMVKSENLDLISKIRFDAALYEPAEGEQTGPGRPKKYGKKVELSKMEAERYLKSTSTKDNLRTDIYQALSTTKSLRLP